VRQTARVMSVSNSLYAMHLQGYFARLARYNGSVVQSRLANRLWQPLNVETKAASARVSLSNISKTLAGNWCRVSILTWTQRCFVSNLSMRLTVNAYYSYDFRKKIHDEKFCRTSAGFSCTLGRSSPRLSSSRNSNRSRVSGEILISRV
jgi:hypothetical protein